MIYASFSNTVVPRHAVQTVLSGPSQPLPGAIGAQYSPPSYAGAVNSGAGALAKLGAPTIKASAADSGIRIRRRWVTALVPCLRMDLKKLSDKNVPGF